MGTLTSYIQQLMAVANTDRQCELIIQVNPTSDDIIPECIAVMVDGGPIVEVYTNKVDEDRTLLSSHPMQQPPTAQYLLSLFTPTHNTVLELLVDGNIVARKPWDTIVGEGA